jgi:ABC-type lipopolysaccharide export system ATPase subunit
MLTESATGVAEGEVLALLGANGAGKPDIGFSHFFGTGADRGGSGYGSLRERVGVACTPVGDRHFFDRMPA